MTSLEEEHEEQRRWRLRPGIKGRTLFDRLVDNEFLSADEQRRHHRRALSAMIRFATARVPYYRDLFARLGLAPEDIRDPEDLARLPLLTKREVYVQGAALRPRALPAGEKVFGITMSSGTTGRPTTVVQSVTANIMFSFLKQREYRWLRFDPAGRLGAIRLASQLPRRPDGAPYGDGETCRLAAWPYVGTVFETGPFRAFNVTNPVDRQIDWLKARRLHYLLSYSETLEHLALACGGRAPGDGLRAVLAISEQLTPSMRRRIEASFAVPVHQNYGLNEVGLVAVRCAAGRYHVHTENVLVEIVDAAGVPCAAGQSGRIAVTALRNAAMPLIRYDTDDVAEVAEGPCPCGRTLPGFGEIVGRYSRIAFLPEGTLGHVGVLREALETMPAALARDLRQFQVHQFRDGGFELRLLAAAPLPEAFGARLRQAWRGALGPGSGRLALRVVEVDHIARGPGGKFQDFTSDFVPAPDDDTDAAPEPNAKPKPEEG